MVYGGDDLNFLAHFWWLVFPLCWLGMEAAKGWERSLRARQILDLAKGYAEQGKEPPASVLEALRRSGHRLDQ